LLAPIEELPDGQGVGHPGVAVADVGGEELDEALARVGAGCRDSSRQRLDAGANGGYVLQTRWTVTKTADEGGRKDRDSL
jgi:hypothetical protein